MPRASPLAMLSTASIWRSPVAALGALLVLAILLTFGPVLRHDFVRWDDTHNFVNHDRILNPSLENVCWFWMHPHADLYVPVTHTVWSVAASIGRTVENDPPAGSRAVTVNPSVFHGLNLLLHVFSGLAAYAVLRRTVRFAWAAWAGAMLFAVHPVQIEAVAWASGTKDVMAGLFGLVAIRQYLAYVQDGAQGRTRWGHYPVGMAALLLAILSKPSAVTVPVIAGVLGWGVSRRAVRDIAIDLAPWFAVAIPFIVIGGLAQPASHLEWNPPLWGRPLIALDALAFYVRQIVLPYRTGAIDYGRSPYWLWHSSQVYVTWIVPVALGVTMVVWRRKLRHAILGAGVLVAGVLPALGLASFDFQAYSTVADRYLYLAMLGPALVVAAFLDQLVQKPSKLVPAAATVGTAAVLVLLATRTFAQVQHWRDSESLFAYALRVNPRSTAANFNLGNHLSDMARTLRGSDRMREFPPPRAAPAVYKLLERSVKHYSDALAAAPEDLAVHYNLANALVIWAAWRKLRNTIDSSPSGTRNIRRPGQNLRGFVPHGRRLPRRLTDGRPRPSPGVPGERERGLRPVWIDRHA